MNNVQIIQILASTHPDFRHFQTKHPDLSKIEMPDELLAQTLTLLEQDPEQAAALTVLRNNPATAKRFMTGGDVAIFIAVAFVLRTHIRLERETDEYGDGKWKFLLEHKPGDSKLITELFKKLEAWIGNKP